MGLFGKMFGSKFGAVDKAGAPQNLGDAAGYVANGIGQASGLAKPEALGTTKGAIAENDQRRQDFAAQLANYQNRTAPQLGPAAQAQTPYMAPVQRADASQLPAYQQAPGAAAFIASQAQASPVQNVQVGPAAQMVAANLGPAQQASMGEAQAQQIDARGGVRNDQLQANQMLQSAAMGNAPSAAEEMLKRGTAANIAGQYALAKTTHGYGQVAALNNAQNNAEQANADLGSRLAELRAGEQAQARGQYAQALQGTRGQDIQADTTNAQLGTDVSKFNAGEQGNTNRFNAGQVNDMALNRARFAQEAAANNMAAQNAVNAQQGNINAAQAQQNAAQGTDVSKFNAGATDAMNRFNEQNRQQNGQFNTGLEADRQKFLANLNAQNSQFNANQANQYNMQGADLAGRIGMYNAGQSNSMAQAQGDLDLKMAGMDDQQKRAYMDFLLNSQQMSITGNIGLAGAQQKANDARWGAIKDIGGAVSSYGAGQSLGAGGGDYSEEFVNGLG